MADPKYSEEIDSLKSDVKALRDDLARLVGAVGDDLEEQGEAARAEARRRLEAARARGQSALDDIESRIERNPLTALAAALGIGFLIGALLGRK